MANQSNLTKSELSEIFTPHYVFNFNLLNVTINTKNVKKAENLMDSGYSPEEIKKLLPYQNWNLNNVQP